MAAFEVQPMDAPFGAEVRGIDPSDPFDAGAAAALSAAFYDHGLLLFPDLHPTMAEQQRLVDVLVSGAPAPLSGRGPELPAELVSNREPGATSGTGKLLHHTDGMWCPEPFDLVSLWAADVAEGAAPTTFASMAAAWDALPDDLREQVDGLHVVHGEGPTVHAARHTDQDFADNPNRRDRTVTTPAVRAHPVTGRTLLYVSEQQAQEVVELPGAPGDQLLQALFAHLYDEGNVIEHTWRNGDLAAWDNHAVQHGRPLVTAEAPTRTLRRAVVPLGSEWVAKWYADPDAA